PPIVGEGATAGKRMHVGLRKKQSPALARGAWRGPPEGGEGRGLAAFRHADNPGGADLVRQKRVMRGAAAEFRSPPRLPRHLGRQRYKSMAQDGPTIPLTLAIPHFGGCSGVGPRLSLTEKPQYRSGVVHRPQREGLGPWESRGQSYATRPECA